jgi:hypothetical protein
MCLSKVIKKFDVPQSEVKIGYKFFSFSQDGTLKTPTKEAPIQVGIWINDEENHPIKFKTGIKMELYEVWNSYTYDYGGYYSTKSRTVAIYDEYPSGFHIFKYKSEAHGYYTDTRLFKVKYRNVVCIGQEGERNVVIAKSIMIPRGQFKI